MTSSPHLICNTFNSVKCILHTFLSKSNDRLFYGGNSNKFLFWLKHRICSYAYECGNVEITENNPIFWHWPLVHQGAACNQCNLCWINCQSLVRPNLKIMCFLNLSWRWHWAVNTSMSAAAIGQIRRKYVRDVIAKCRQHRDGGWNRPRIRKSFISFLFILNQWSESRRLLHISPISIKFVCNGHFHTRYTAIKIMQIEWGYRLNFCV